MIATLCTLALLGARFQPGPDDLLETGLLYWWTDLAAIEPSRILLDGMPLLLSGEAPAPPWGSFDALEILSPIESGVWGGGRWTVDLSGRDIPDSSFDSTVGLLENTVYRNRYSGGLFRPLPLGTGLGAVLSREDTLSSQYMRIERPPFSAGGIAWQAGEDGYSGHAAMTASALDIRAGLASTSAGSRALEGLLTLEPPAGPVELAVAAGISGWDTLGLVEGHALARMPAGRFTLVARGDLGYDGEEIDPAFTAGTLVETGGPRFGLAWGGAPGLEHHLTATADWGPAGARVSLPGGGAVLGARVSLTPWLGLSALSSGDSLRFGGRLAPSIGYGARGRLRLGGRGSWTRVSGEDDWDADILASFELLGFTLVCALEDVPDDEARSITYGIVWSFSDSPAWSGDGEERDR